MTLWHTNIKWQGTFTAKGVRSPIRLMGPKSVSHLYSYAYNYKRHTVRYAHLLSYGIHFYYVVVELSRISWHKHNCSTYHQNTIQIHVYVVTTTYSWQCIFIDKSSQKFDIYCLRYISADIVTEHSIPYNGASISDARFPQIRCYSRNMKMISRSSLMIMVFIVSVK